MAFHCFQAGESLIASYPGMDVDATRLRKAANRARILGKITLIAFGAPSAFLFVGTMIALATGQPVAPRALIVFPVLAIVVFGSSGTYLVCARHIRCGRRWAVLLSLCVATSVRGCDLGFAEVNDFQNTASNFPDLFEVFRGVPTAAF